MIEKLIYLNTILTLSYMNNAIFYTHDIIVSKVSDAVLERNETISGYIYR